MLNVFLFFGGVMLCTTVYHIIRTQCESVSLHPPGKLINLYPNRPEWLHYTSCGSGRPVFVLLHAFAVSDCISNFYPLIQRLQSIGTVVAFDRYGYGWSSHTTLDRTLKQRIYDIKAFLEHLNCHSSIDMQQTILVGHSVGAAEALQFVQQFPKEVAGIVLLDGGSPSFYKYGISIPKWAPLYYYTVRLLRVTGVLRLLIGLRMLPVLNHMYGNLPSHIRSITIRLLQMRIFNRTQLLEARKLASNDLLPDQIYDVPLLQVSAEHKTMQKNFPRVYGDIMSDRDQIAACSANSRHCIIPDTSHNLILEQPDRIAAEIIDYLHAACILPLLFKEQY